MAKHTADSIRKGAYSQGAITTVLFWLVILLFVVQPARGSIQSGTVDSLVVLPFETVGENSENPYLAPGIFESVTRSLSRLKRLRLVSLSTVSRYRDKDPRQVGHELNSRVAVSGKVEVREKSIQIHITLLQVESGAKLEKEYSGSFADILSLQGKIARGIAEDLEIDISGRAEKAFDRPETRSAEAYLLYLRGRHHGSRGGRADLEKALDLFHQATELDPKFALAYAGQANTLANLRAFRYLPHDLAFQQSRAAAKKAVEADGSLVEAHYVLARILAWPGLDWEGAEREYKSALKLNPNDLNLHMQYGYFLMNLGRRKESVESVLRGLALDPNSPSVNTNVAFVMTYARQYEQAIKQIDRAMELNLVGPTPPLFKGWISLARGNTKEGVRWMLKSAELAGGGPGANAAHAFAMNGQKEEARKLLQERLERARQRYVSPVYTAVIYLGLGEIDEMFALLEEGFEKFDSNILILKIDPRFDSLRTHPRFQVLIERLNYPADQAAGRRSAN